MDGTGKTCLQYQRLVLKGFLMGDFLTKKYMLFLLYKGLALACIVLGINPLMGENSSSYAVGVGIVLLLFGVYFTAKSSRCQERLCRCLEHLSPNKRMLFHFPFQLSYMVSVLLVFLLLREYETKMLYALFISSGVFVAMGVLYFWFCGQESKQGV